MVLCLLVYLFFESISFFPFVGGGGVVCWVFVCFVCWLVANHLLRKTKSLENGLVLLGSCLVAILVWHRM